MPTITEYAALSAFIYNDQRGGGSGEINPINILDLLSGWTQLRPSNGFAAQTAYDDNFFSFTAGAFVNTSTGEIVISYKGTDFLVEFAGRAWNTAGDIVTDLSAGIGGYVSTAQFTQAASATFAEAPFEATVSSPLTVPAIQQALALKGFNDPDFNAFLSGWANPIGNAVFTARQALVANYYNQGEFLNYLRFAANTVYATSDPIPIGDQPASRALALHSMNLHCAFLFDQRLQELARSMPTLVPAQASNDACWRFAA